MDYEVELAVVIGKPVKRNTPEDQVMGLIAGYTIMNDVSARDMQFKDQQITLGKNFDTFAPMGPMMVTTDELVSPEDTKLMTMVNNKMVQDGTHARLGVPAAQADLRAVARHDPGAGRRGIDGDAGGRGGVPQAAGLSQAWGYGHAGSAEHRPAREPGACGVNRRRGVSLKVPGPAGGAISSGRRVK